MGKLSATALAVAALSSAALTTTGCSGGNDDWKPFGSNEASQLKVMFNSETAFYLEFGSLFVSRFPNVDVEVDETQSMYRTDGGVFSQQNYDEALSRFIDERQPDVLLLNADQYAQLAADGKLLNLEPLIKQDKFDVEGIQPAITQLLRDRGNGALYGLSPEFRSQALFYNADLFRRYGVEPPRDSMSWSEVLALAERFPTEDDNGKRLYGFAFEAPTTLTFLADRIARTENLRAVSPDGTTATMTGGGWKQAFEDAIAAYKSQTVNLEDNPQPESGPLTLESVVNGNAFAAGQAAMTLSYPYLISNITQSQAYLNPDKPLAWRVVTEPVGSNDRTIGGSFSVDTVFAVNAKAANPRAAWAFIKYVAGEDFARVRARALTAGQLLSRPSAVWDPDGRGMAAFYKLQPGPEKTLGMEQAPAAFYTAFINEVLQGELSAAADGSKTIDEAMAAIQAKAQQALDQERLQEQAAAGSAAPAQGSGQAK